MDGLFIILVAFFFIIIAVVIILLFIGNTTNSEVNFPSTGSNERGTWNKILTPRGMLPSYFFTARTISNSGGSYLSSQGGSLTLSTNPEIWTFTSQFLVRNSSSGENSEGSNQLVVNQDLRLGASTNTLFLFDSYNFYLVSDLQYDQVRIIDPSSGAYTYVSINNLYRGPGWLIS